jgi:hypothetical protein
MAKRLVPQDALVIHDAADALTFPPALVLVPDSWSSREAGHVAEWDLRLLGAAALNFTVGLVYAAELRDQVVAPTAMTSVDAGTDQITKVAHGFLTGDGPLYPTSSVVLPSGLVATTPYWVIEISADTFQLAGSLADAVAKTPVPIDMTTAGSGVLTVTGPAAQRVVYLLHATLATPIALDAQKGFRQTLAHRPEHIGYGLVGSLSASNLTALATPVVEKS